MEDAPEKLLLWVYSRLCRSLLVPVVRHSLKCITHAHNARDAEDHVLTHMYGRVGGARTVYCTALTDGSPEAPYAVGRHASLRPHAAEGLLYLPGRPREFFWDETAGDLDRTWEDVGTTPSGPQHGQAPLGRL